MCVEHQAHFTIHDKEADDDSSLGASDPRPPLRSGVV